MIAYMKKRNIHIRQKTYPVIIERGEDGWFIATMPLFTGCYTQGKTIDEALKNIREAIVLCTEDKENEDVASTFSPLDISLHTVAV
jgi:predicted RNase H-like HicB family nuclease